MQTTNHRVLASLPTHRASSSQPRVLNAVVVLVILIAAALGVAAVAVVAHDVAGRDASTVYYAPDHDAAGEPTCPLGQHLYDTEQPDQGDSGIVCVAATKAV